MANFYPPATNITAVKQEPPQSPPQLPPTEPIMQPISFATLVAAIKQELLQPPHSLPLPTIILRPSIAPSTPILPPSQPPSTPIPTPTPSLLYPNLVPPPSLQPPTHIPTSSLLRPNLVTPPLVSVKTEPDQSQPPQQQQELLQPPPSLPPPPIILRRSLDPSTPIPPPSLQPKTPIPTPSLLRPDLVPPPSIPPPTPIPTPSLLRPNQVPPPLTVVKTEPDQPQPPPPTPSLLYPNLVTPPSLQPPTSIPTPSLHHPDLVTPPLAVVKTESDQPQPPPQQQQELPQPPPSLPLPTIILRPSLAPSAPILPLSQPSPPQQQKPQFLKSINDLASLSKALNSFNAKFEDLTNHIVSINQAIDSKFNEPPPAHTNTTSSTTPPPQHQQQQIQTPKPTKTKTPNTNSPPKPPEILIQSFCQKMRPKLVRKYIISNLQDISKLREEIPEALKLAPEPAKLVLDCIGQFFVVSHINNPYIMTARKALVLLLEIFGTFHGRNRVIFAVEVKVEAEKIAIGWRKRLIREGGIDKASEIDARALLLFVGYFGIPRVFSNVELGNLFNLSNPRGISDSLKASPLLPCRIPDIVDTMAKTRMHVKALEVASIFGLEDKLSPGIIVNSLLPESTKAFEHAQKKERKNPIALKEATENHLVALRLTVRCLEDRGDYGTMLLGSWKIKEKIVKLEEEIAELDKRIAKKKKKRPKRKADQIGSSSMAKSQEVKRLRTETEGSPLPKSNVDQLCEQSTADVLAEGDGLIPDSLNANNNYPAVSAVPSVSAISAVPSVSAISAAPAVSAISAAPAVSVAPAVSAAPAVSVAPAVSAAPHGSSNEIGQTAGTTGVGSSGIGVMPESSYSVKEEDIEVDDIGQTISGNGLPYKWQQGCVPQSTTMWFSSLFGPSPSVEGFVGVLDSTVRTQADRYKFADSLA